MKRPSHNHPRPKFFLASMAALTAGVFLGGSSARATTYNWTSATGTGTNDFNTATNWTPNGVPGTATTDLATFGDPTGLNTTVNLSAVPGPFATISFNATTAAGYDLTSSSTAIGFTLNSATAISGTYTSGTNTIDAPVALTAASTAITLATTSTSNTVEILRINGVISGSSNIAVQGKATVDFFGANTYTGTTTVGNGSGSVAILAVNTIGTVGGGASGLGAPTTVAAGTIQLGNNSATGTLQYLGTGSTTDRRINLGATTGGAFIDSSGTGALIFTGVAGTNDVTTTTAGAASRNLTFTGSYGTFATTNQFGEKITDLTVSGTSYATNIFKTGAGTWALSGANTYTGATTVSGGTLIAANATALGGAAATPTLSGGTLDLAVDSGLTAYNTVAVGNVTSTIVSDRATTGAGVTQTLGTLNMNAAAVLNVAAGANVTSGTAAVAFGATTLSDTGVSNNFRFNPTTANVSLTSVTGAITSSTAVGTLILDGTSTGNAITGAISNGSGGGTVALVKSNTSTWTLSGANTYTGATAINGGILAITNTNASAITVNAGTLTGTGSTTGVLTLVSGGNITPGTAGSATGTLTGASLTFNSGAALSYTLSGTSNASNNLTLTGALSKGGTGTYTINFTGGQAGQTYDLINYGSTTFTTGSGTNFDFTAVGDTGTFTVTGTGLSFTVTAVPEPSTWVGALFLSVLGALGLRRRFRRQQA